MEAFDTPRAASLTCLQGHSSEGSFSRASVAHKYANRAGWVEIELRFEGLQGTSVRWSAHQNLDY